MLAGSISGIASVSIEDEGISVEGATIVSSSGTFWLSSSGSGTGDGTGA
jgi:hypothetical protein